MAVLRKLVAVVLGSLVAAAVIGPAVKLLGSRSSRPVAAKMRGSSSRGTSGEITHYG